MTTFTKHKRFALTGIVFVLCLFVFQAVPQTAHADYFCSNFDATHGWGFCWEWPTSDEETAYYLATEWVQQTFCYVSDEYGYGPGIYGPVCGGVPQYNMTIRLAPVYCTSDPNACGQTNYGYCPQDPPANPGYLGQSCSATSGANACGQTSTNYGSFQCDGSCSVGAPGAPANPAGYGNSCASPANSCGQVNYGSIQCNGTCSAIAPSNSSCPLPDLTTIPTPVALSASVGVPVTLSVPITNSGSGSTGRSFLSEFLVANTSGVWDPSGTNVTIATLGAGASTNATLSKTFSSPGTYYYQFCGNYYNYPSWPVDVTESNYGNNCNGSAGVVTVSPPAPAPPTITGASCNAAGTQLTVSWSAPTWATSYHYRNDDQQVSSCGSWYCSDPPDYIRDYYTSNSIVMSVIPGHSNSYWVHSVNSAGQYSAPTYGYTVCAGQSDLLAGGSGITSGGAAGSPTNFGGAIYNYGTATVGPFPNMFQIENVTTFAATSISSLGPTPPNPSISVYGSYTFPSAGTYRVRLCADNDIYWQGSINNESNESNNCGSWLDVSIAAPDLTASTPGALTGTYGTPLTVSGTISNVGSGSAAAHSSVIQICGNGTSDASCNTVQTNTQRPVGALAASASQAISTSYSFPVAGPHYSYRVCADNWSPTVGESQEGNNCTGWSYITISAPAISCSLTTNPSPLVGGASGTFSWNSSGTGCTGGGFSTGGAANGGPVNPDQPQPIPPGGNYTLNCTAAGATACNIAVSATAPTADISASPDRVNQTPPNNTSNITWMMANCTTNSVTKNGVLFSPNLTGTNVSSGPITGQTTFTATCDSVTDSVIVNVIPRVEEF